MCSYPTITAPVNPPSIRVVCSIYFVRDKVRAIGVHDVDASPAPFENIAFDFLRTNNLTKKDKKFTGHVWIYENGDLSFMRSE